MTFHGNVVVKSMYKGVGLTLSFSFKFNLLSIVAL